MRSWMKLIAIGTALLVVGCSDSNSGTSAATNTTPVPAAPAAPALATPPAEAAETSVTITGPIIVEHQVEIAAQRDGIIDKVFLDAPARVKAGAILAHMDDGNSAPVWKPRARNPAALKPT